MKKLLIILALLGSLSATQSKPYASVANFPATASISSIYTALMAMYPAANAVMPCVTVQIQWAQYDSGTTAPSYQFGQLDTDVAAIWNNGGVHQGPNCINFIVAPVVNGTNNTFTPQYVFTTAYKTAIGATRQQTITVSNSFAGSGSSPHGNASCTQCTPTDCTSGCRYVYDPSGTLGINDFSGFPEEVPAEPITRAWNDFVNAFCAHTAAWGTTYNTQYVRFGAGTSGESNVAGTPSWIIDAPFSNAEDAYILNANSQIKQWYTTWAGYASANSINYQLDYNYHTWNPSSDITAADTMATIIAGLTPTGGLDTNGLRYTDITAFGSGGSTSANWYSNNRKYRSQLLSVLQTFTESDPTNGDPNGCGAATPCDGSATGSLEAVIPFAAANGVNVLEIYPSDALVIMTATYAALPGSIRVLYPSASFTTYGTTSGTYYKVLQLFQSGAMTAPAHLRAF